MTGSVLVCGRLPERGRAALEEAGLVVDHQPDRGTGSLADIIEPHAGVIVHSPHQVDEATIAAAANLRAVGRAGVGVDNIDIAACTDRGILVMNLPWGNTVSAAEHTVALLMAMARNIPQASAALRQGEWDRGAHLGVELDGKSLGIVGLGRIGQQVARRAHGLGMTVLGTDPFLSPSLAADLGIELCSFEDLLPRCQFLTVHVPRTPETVGMINAGTLSLLPEGARLVNCARGGVVDEAALLAALESGRLGGAACDVFEIEPTDNAALLAHPAFIGTPHLGAATQEARQRVGVGIARQMADYLAQGVIRNAINVQALPPDEHQAMAPYLGLARSLGTFLAHCFEGIERLQIEYFGEITEFTLSPLTSNIVAGLLGHFLELEVNEVNAMGLAQERELQIDEKKGGAWPGYSSLVRVTASAGGREHVVAGTVFDRDRARLVEIDGFAVDVAPEGRMLVFVNDDAPGVVGTVGTFLAERDVNIADMSLGRDRRGGTAIATLIIDEALTHSDLEDLKAHERMRWVRQVVF